MTASTERAALGLQILTAVTGLVDAVSFLGLGRTFTANMTGNVVLLAFAVAGTPRLSVARSATALAGFVAGAVLGGRLGTALAGTQHRRWLVTSALTEVGLLFAAGLIAVDVDPASAELPHRAYAVIVLTAVAMGLQTATARRLAIPDLNTTVVTVTLAGLAAESWFAGGNDPRFGRRVVSLALLFAGAVLGALLLPLGPAVPLALAGAGVLAVAVTYRDVPS